ncbi:hypothetical protein BH10PAT3_BH10PAT3_8250 [soil metagenome]
MRRLSGSHDGGFTIVELLIATAVFSVILLLIATAAVQVGRTFYKGVTINRVQDTSRRVAEDIVQSIQFGVNSASFYRSGGTPGATETRCLGEVRYTFDTAKSLGTAAGQSRHILWKDHVAVTDNCMGTLGSTPIPNLTAIIPSVGGQEMVGDNMRVPVITTEESPIGSIISWIITVKVSYGNKDDVFEVDGSGNPDYGRCMPQRAGGQFCAVSTINTNAEKRL